jgi:predicted HAD superfamily Cof-like phosphohydrolase
MDFVSKVIEFNEIAGNKNEFSVRKSALYCGLIAEEFSEKLDSLNVDTNNMTDDEVKLIDTISSLKQLSVDMKWGVYDQLFEKLDRVESVDADIDLAVVALGAAIVAGADVQGACHNVADSNLSKFPIVNGERVVYKNESGKVIKPDSYTPASIAQFLK